MALILRGLEPLQMLHMDAAVSGSDGIVHDQERRKGGEFVRRFGDPTARLVDVATEESHREIPINTKLYLQVKFHLQQIVRARR
jgi:hypothetical protein